MVRTKTKDMFKTKKVNKDKIQTRKWIGTRNFKNVKLTSSPFEFLKSFYSRSDSEYLVGQEEIGEEGGNNHIQFFFILKKKERLSYLKKLDHESHFKPIFKDNGVSEYCMKEETRVSGPWSFGVKSMITESGKVKYDWSEIKKKMKEGKYDEVPDYLYVQSYNKMKTIRSDNVIKLNTEDFTKRVRVYFISGKSGIGKTTFSKYMIGKEYFNLVKFTGDFWIGTSEDCDVCLYDDFRDSHLTESEFINFIDYNKHIFNIKHGQQINNYRLIIFTSTQRLNDLFRQSTEQKEQWLRRTREIFLDDDYFTNMSTNFDNFKLLFFKYISKLLLNNLIKYIDHKQNN